MIDKIVLNNQGEGKMKKLLTIMLSVLMVCALGACSKKETTETESGPVVETETAETTEATETETADAELANPWVDCADGQEAAQIAGFEFDAPESETTAMAYRAVEGQIIEVSYGSATEGTVARKALGFDAADLSGDYNEYEAGGTMEVGDDNIVVTYAGKDEETVNNAYWTIGDYSYSLYDVNGISVEAVEEFVAAAK